MTNLDEDNDLEILSKELVKVSQKFRAVRSTKTNNRKQQIEELINKHLKLYSDN